MTQSNEGGQLLIKSGPRNINIETHFVIDTIGKSSNKLFTVILKLNYKKKIQF